MKLDESKFKKMHGYEEGKIDVLDSESADIALSYKKNVLKNFTLLNQDTIVDRLRGSEYFVTRKYDGEYAIIFYENGGAITVNRSGRVRRGIPCIEEAKQLMENAGIRQGIFPAEIYVKSDYKTRVNDLIHTLAREELIGNLQLAVFDILEIDGKPFRSSSFDITWKEITRIFGKGILCHPVDMRVCYSGNEVLKIYNQYVHKENSEGVVVHSPIGIIYKVKPRHFFDVVVLGYAEGSGGEAGQVRSLLTALIPENGKYQVMTRAGAGLVTSLRKELFQYFSTRGVANPFEGMATKYADIQFVEPDLVIEISIEEIVSEIASGERTNYLLSFDMNSGYRLEGVVSGAKFYTPVFIRLRPDKLADEHDVSAGQLEKYKRLGKKPNELLLKDVYINGKADRVKHSIYKGKNGVYKYFREGTDKTCFPRYFRRDKNIHNIVLEYQSDLFKAAQQGYCRDNDQLVVTPEFMEEMRYGEDEW